MGSEETGLVFANADGTDIVKKHRNTANMCRIFMPTEYHV